MPHPIDNLLAKAKYIRRYKKPDGKWGYVYPKDKTRASTKGDSDSAVQQAWSEVSHIAPKFGVKSAHDLVVYGRDVFGGRLGAGRAAKKAAADMKKVQEQADYYSRTGLTPPRPLFPYPNATAKKKKSGQQSQDWHGGQEHVEAIKRHANVDDETAANMVVHANVHRMQHSGGGVPSKRDVQKLKQHYDKHGDKSGAKGGKAPEPDEALQNKPKSKKQKKSKPVEVHENPMGDPVVQQGSNHVVFSATDNGVRVTMRGSKAARFAEKHPELFDYARGNPRQGVVGFMQVSQDKAIKLAKEHLSKADTMSVDRLLSKSSKRSFVSGGDQGSGGGSSSGRSSSGSAATAGASAGSSTGGGSGGTGSSRTPVFEPGSGSKTKQSSLWGKMSLYDFTSKHQQKDAAKIPDKYLLDYLCSFVEEAYEHEAREPKHKNVPAENRAGHFARLVMNELVQAITTNKNLMRAAQRYNVNVNVIERILVSKGILKPKSDSDWTDKDSAQAMGANALAADVAGEGMAYSAPSAWMQPDPFAPEGRPLHKGPVDNVAAQVVDDSIDPSTSLQSFQAAQARALWPGSEPVGGATIAPDCPVHNGADMTKAQNLWNPMAPCTCKGEPNAYG